MAFHIQFSSLLISTSNFMISRPRACLAPTSVSRLRSGVASCPVQCVADITRISNDEKIIARRSANYQPPIWNFDFVQSLQTQYTRESYAERFENLKEVVREILSNLEDDPLAQLEHIDMLQRLGISYHFDEEIKCVLEEIYNNNSKKNNDLYAIALEFRLLRQHGYSMPQEVFNAFRDEMGNFSADTVAMLSLYEASFHMIKGESILEEARDLSIKCLEEYIKTNKVQNDVLSLLVSHALELPLHWRMPRLESRWFIDLYERRHDKNPFLLEFAKLDFNIVQSTHQEDLKHASRWWRNTGLEKLDFARDRLVENFLWTVGFAYEPQFGYYRRTGTEVIAFITLIDDIYDVYGTLDELELFTNAVERWDTDAMDELPDYMKMCFLAFYNSVNDMAFHLLKEQGIHIIKYLKKGWADLCKGFLVEAKWYYSGYTPTFQEYIDNAWISISIPMILVHAYLFAANPTKEALNYLEEYSSIFRHSGILFRLLDDLGTSSNELKRGDVPKSIQCYMYEARVLEEKACQDIKLLIHEKWKHVNEERVADSPFSKTFIEIAMNVVRTGQFFYQYGDGYAIQDRETKEHIVSLFVDPIPL
ncbi:Myrcene synthase [Morus notabilis]|uniref:Myrcene synthase n=1 Tax=Morus notabilis TaxID=981085 RepID=W9QVA8_9ROSA|nr:terpene synthase 10 [Morus notabilis]EXB39111.1 Myrcene synthase [Morus notabilis]